MNDATKMVLLAVTFTFTACSTTPQVNTTDSLDARIQANIDPEIQGQERAVIAEHMRDLKPEDWANVTYIHEGRIYVNRVSLQGWLEVAQPAGDNVYRLSDGSTFATPQEAEDGLMPQSTTCTTSSGSFRRVKTKPGTGPVSIGLFGYVNGFVTTGGLLLSDNFGPPILNLTSTVGETAYAYLGTSSNGAGLAESDAGVQWSVTNTNWAPYVKSGNTIATSKSPYLVNTRYTWSGGVTLTYIVLADGKARITYSGTIASNSPKLINPYPIDFDVAGLKLSGLGNVFKRITSIAQVTKPNPPATGVPTFNGTTGAVYTMEWFNLKLGLTASSGLHDWGQTAFDVAEDCVTAKTQVGALGSSAEEVLISLN
jgi:hypothetical protein